MEDVNFTPFHDRVLVKRQEAVRKRIGAIELPDSQSEPPLEGMVVKVGEGGRQFGQLVVPSAQVGDSVLFARFAGVEIEIDGEEYLLLRDEEILGARKR